jgi:hypothetical protein
VLVGAGSAPTGTLGADRLSVTVASLTSLAVYLVPLIALLMSFDAIAGEVERGTLPLMLTYPVGRAELLLGKFWPIWRFWRWRGGGLRAGRGCGLLGDPRAGSRGCRRCGGCSGPRFCWARPFWPSAMRCRRWRAGPARRRGWPSGCGW